MAPTPENPESWQVRQRPREILHIAYVSKKMEHGQKALGAPWLLQKHTLTHFLVPETGHFPGTLAGGRNKLSKQWSFMAQKHHSPPPS